MLSLRDYPYMVERLDICNRSILYDPASNGHAPGRYRCSTYELAVESHRTLSQEGGRAWAIYRWSIVERRWALMQPSTTQECPT